MTDTSFLGVCRRLPILTSVEREKAEVLASYLLSPFVSYLAPDAAIAVE